MSSGALSNLPPGVGPGDIPGNRAEDAANEQLVAAVLKHADLYGWEATLLVVAAAVRDVPLDATGPIETVSGREVYAGVANAIERLANRL